MSDSLSRRIILLIILLAFALFLLGIDAKSIWWDESLSLFRAQQDVSYILTNHLHVNETLTIDQHPPLYFLVLRGAILLAGESDLALRFPSAFFATLVVPLLYVLAKRMAGPRAGLLAALWGALSPFYLWYAQEVRMYTMVTAIGAVGTYCLWRAVDESKPWWIAGFIATIIAGVTTLYFYGLIVAVQLLLAFVLLMKARPIGKIADRRVIIIGLSLGISMIAFFTWLVAPQVRALLQDPLPGRSYISFGNMLLDALNSFSLGISVRFDEVWPLQLLYLGVYLVGVLWVLKQRTTGIARTDSTRRRQIASLVLLMGFPILPLIFFWVVSLYKPIYMGSRYIILFSPSFYLGLGLGLEAIWRKSRYASLILVLMLATGMLYSTQRYHRHPLYTTKEDHRSAANLVTSQELPGDIIVLTAPENIFAFEHYYAGQLDIMPQPDPPLAMPDPQAVDQTLRQLTMDYDRIWLVYGRTQWSDPDDIVLGWLNGQLPPLMRARFASYGSDIEVHLYSTKHTVLSDGNPVNAALATCDEHLALLDYRIRYFDTDMRPVMIEHEELLETSRDVSPALGGRAIGLRLEWQVLAPLEGYKLSLRLLDEQGRVWAQNDNRPLYYQPTQTWPVGSVVAHDSILPLPIGTPSGIYTLNLVVYNEDEIIPLRCLLGNDDGSLNIGQITVGPTPSYLLPAPLGLTPSEERLAWPPRHLGPWRLMGLRASPPMGASLEHDQPMELLLYWFAQEAEHSNYDVVVHWSSGRNVLHRQVFPMVSGGYTAGEALTSAHLLTVPQELPPGDYTLRLLLYDRQANAYERLRLGLLSWPTRNLRLGQISIE